MKKAVVVLSGGQDSTTCLFWANQDPETEIHCITFDYNQRHDREINSAIKVAQLVGVESHEVIALGPVLKGTSPLVSSEPLEQYANHRSLPGGLEKTFVPMRNQLFLTIAANRAAVLGAKLIITGVCEEDYGGYPDCRRSFIDELESSINLALGIGSLHDRIMILTPLMKLTKKKTVQLALTLPGCYEALAYSHTSYDGAYPPTGKDHATLLRAKGFEEADVPDPLVLRAWSEGKMDIPDSGNYRSSILKKYLDMAGLDERSRLL